MLLLLRIFFLLSPDSVRRQISDVPRTFHCIVYFVVGGIHTCLGVFSDPMFLWISWNSCPLNLLLVRSYLAEIIIAKRLIQGRSNVIRVRVEPRPFDQGRRKNFGHAADKMVQTQLVQTKSKLCFMKKAVPN